MVSVLDSELVGSMQCKFRADLSTDLFVYL